MTAILAYVVAALLYDPQPHDALRFGLPIEPADERPGAACWYSPVQSAFYTAAWNAAIAFRFSHLNEANLAEYELLAFKRNVWYYAAILANAKVSEESRSFAGRRLRDLIGPLDYYAGVLPSPTP